MKKPTQQNKKEITVNKSSSNLKKVVLVKVKAKPKVNPVLGLEGTPKFRHLFYIAS